MIERLTMTSMTRIADFNQEAVDVGVLPFETWSTGDYVVGRAAGLPGNYAPIELANGRMVPTARGDLIVGALGVRHATLEVTGSWRCIGEDMMMRALTGAGIFGKMTSKSPFCPTPIPLRYEGHVFTAGRRSRMRDYVEKSPVRAYRVPTIVLLGSSMSAGKTTVGQTVIRVLKSAGLRVAGAKLTGAGRYRDILAMSDAGADHVLDFVDAGIPSTVCPVEEYSEVLTELLSRIAILDPDVAVVEVGASPLEPYNGSAAILGLGEWLRCSILCASDPYAVVGVMEAFGIVPDLVSGVATNTRAGIELIQKLCQRPAVNILDSGAEAIVAGVLARTLELSGLTVGESPSILPPLVPT